MRVIAAVLYVCATLILSWVITHGDWITACATGMAVILGAIPTILICRQHIEEESLDRLKGSILAGNHAFMRELRTMDHDHRNAVEQIAAAKGAAAARADIAEAKIARMTTRPKIKGRIVSQDDPRLQQSAGSVVHDHRQPHLDIIDATAQPPE